MDRRNALDYEQLKQQEKQERFAANVKGKNNDYKDPDTFEHSIDDDFDEPERGAEAAAVLTEPSEPDSGQW